MLVEERYELISRMESQLEDLFEDYRQKYIQSEDVPYLVQRAAEIVTSYIFVPYPIEESEYNKEEIVRILVDVLYKKGENGWLGKHAENVSECVTDFGQYLGLNLDYLKLVGLLHDLGKLGIPRSILDANRKLTSQELEIARLHPQIGQEILKPYADFQDVLPFILYHHVYSNGEGYPNGIERENLPHWLRILQVVDSFYAIMESRPYQDGLDSKTALREIQKEGGNRLDKSAVEEFEEYLISSTFI